MSRRTLAQAAAWCEFDGCCNAAVATVNGIRVCERCRREFVSCGHGAVYFAGRWHGVQGATYTDEQSAAFPGVRQPQPTTDLRGGPWARQARGGIQC